MSKSRIGVSLLSLGLATACGSLSTSLTGTGTSTATSGGTLPLITPIVKKALPAGLGGTAASSHFQVRNLIKIFDTNDNGSGNGALLSTDISALKSRFFSGQGPTEIVGQLMPSLDSLISGVNSAAASSSSACLTQTPVAYTITPAGQSIPMYAQCYFAGTPSYSAGNDAATDGSIAHIADPAFMQFGIKDGVTYIYSANGAEWVAAIVTPVGTGYSVTAYLGVGYSNFLMTGQQGGDWDSGSYGLIEFAANSEAGTFELATAGSGLGYCGAQLNSDGTNIYAIVSNDMGTSCGNQVNNAGPYFSDDLCVLASDSATPSTACVGASAFTLLPIGRIGGVNSSTNNVSMGAAYASSTYPTNPNVTFNGTTTDALHFGPIAPTTGVGQLTSGGGNGSGNPPTAAQLASDITTACPGISSQNALTAATAALAAYGNSGNQNDAITALDASLSGNSVSQQNITCANTAVENS